MGQHVDEFSKLAHYAPDDVATDVMKQEVYGRAERWDEYAVEGGSI